MSYASTGIKTINERLNPYAIGGDCDGGTKEVALEVAKAPLRAIGQMVSNICELGRWVVSDFRNLDDYAIPLDDYTNPFEGEESEGEESQGVDLSGPGATVCDVELEDKSINGSSKAVIACKVGKAGLKFFASLFMGVGAVVVSTIGFVFGLATFVPALGIAGVASVFCKETPSPTSDDI